MWYVYVLYDKIGDRFYIGITENLKRRMYQHEIGQTHTTARYTAKDLIFSEEFICELDARRRERYLKTTQGRKTLRLTLRETLKEYKNCPVV